MKRFLKFYQKDKQNIKMVNQSHKGFDLIILSDEILKKILEIVNSCEENNDEIHVIWQMKFKRLNYIMYKNCTFSAPIDNIFREKKVGKKINVKCSNTNFYSESILDKNERVKGRDGIKTQEQYKDYKLLERMLKIGELNLKCD